MIGKLGFFFGNVSATALVVSGEANNWSGDGTALDPLVGPILGQNPLTVTALKSGTLSYTGEQGDGTVDLFYEITKNGEYWDAGYAAQFNGSIPVLVGDSVTFFMFGNLAVDTWSLYVS